MLLESEKQFLEQIQAQKLNENTLKDLNIQLKYDNDQMTEHISIL